MTLDSPTYRPRWAYIHPTRAWLYSVHLARPKRTPTLAQERALDHAMAARQTCSRCRRRYYFCLPLRTLGCCLLRTTGHVPMPCPASLRSWERTAARRLHKPVKKWDITPERSR
ncbi:RRQRL motif-containing zinc-binding protein [Streptomyces coeruleorubidus]